MVATGRLDDATQQLLHETVHWWLAAQLGGLPLWLNEGLVNYFATLRIERERIVVGAAPHLRFGSLQVAELGVIGVHAMPGLEELLDASWLTFHNPDRRA